jgi:septal ring factor EnvC (AmiA/AmiB activator)
MSELIAAIRQLSTDISEIKQEINKIDQRIGDLEQDAYYYHAYEADRETLERDYTNQAEQSGRQTPIFNKYDPEEIEYPGYQRKRPATSPAQDLRSTQENLHSRIDAMGNTLETISSTLLQFENLGQSQNNEDTNTIQSD